MTDDLQLRRARPDEFERIGELCVRAYAPSGMAADNPYWDRLREVAQRAGDAEVWVAADATGILGTATWCPPCSGQREVSRDGEAEFRMLAVDPDRQGRGVGRLLLEAVIDRARRENCTAVVLSSAAWMTTAHLLYQRRGFHRTPELDWSPMPGVDLLTFRLDLVHGGAVEAWRAARTASGEPPDAARVTRVREKLRDPEARIFTSREDGRGVAMALAEPFREPDGSLRPGWGHLSMMFVHPDHQARGVGDALLRRIRAEIDWPNLSVWTRDANIRARRLYRRQGFLPTTDTGTLHPDRTDHADQPTTRWERTDDAVTPRLHADEEPVQGWTTMSDADLAALLTERSGPDGRLLVLVDGRGGSGKSTTAGRLAAALDAAGVDAAVVHTDDIAWNLHAIDWTDELIGNVIEPWRRGEPVSYRPPGWISHDRPGTVDVPASRALIVEGVGAGRARLATLADVVCWVQTDASVAYDRGVARDIREGRSRTETEDFWEVWMDDEEPHLRTDRPWARANVIVDGTTEQTSGRLRVHWTDQS